MADINVCTMTLPALAALLAACSGEPPPPPPPPPGPNLSQLLPKEWILQNFANVKAYTNDNNPVFDTMGHGSYYSTNLTWPAMIRDSVVEGGYYGLRIQACDQYASTCTPSPDMRVAYLDVTARNQTRADDGSFYGASIITIGTYDNPWTAPLETFMVNVTMEPNWPAWAGYRSTNMDGFTGDAGSPNGLLIGYNITVKNWAEAALDVKQKHAQFVGLRTESTPERGYNTLKLWRVGPHYLVDSTINNERYLNAPADPPLAAYDDGGLLWTNDCAGFELRVWNTTFNGSSTLPLDRIKCSVGNREDMKITYLTVDPRTTGELHPMLHQARMP